VRSSSVIVGLIAFALAGGPSVGQAQNASARIYVRRIEFQGVTRISDEVLRREMLQVEGTVLNTVALEESRLRLERLPYVADAQVSLRPVPSALNVVDVLVAITEAPPRRYGGGGAYSESLRTSIHGYFINENLFGTGRQFSARVEASEIGSIGDVSYTDPYARPAGVARTIGLSSRRIERLTVDTSSVDADLAEARLEYAYRAGERQTMRFGLGWRSTELTAGTLTSDQLLDWIRSNGNPATSAGFASTDFAELTLFYGWHRDTRDRSIFPQRGTEQSAALRLALPASEVEYYAADYEITAYHPLGSRWTMSARGILGSGRGYGDTSALPPYLNWFAGGPKTVRGYRENGLGPRDSLGNPYGGNLLTAAQLELMTPWPGRWRERMKVGFFVDVGNVFSNETVVFEDAGARLDYGFAAGELRQSVGIAVDLLLPLSRVRLSYAVPLNADDDHANPALRDRIEPFQISFGVDF
jgi:outer membrane protein insertion porin family